ncbi:hypothetical protein KOI35_07910 [Actinoplanes bogorensis]|uniref:PepSY domain-containing protein n=1 Tax=Paractinoplanes bogorensis TaxID=1610840 RepID=A0ABS5YJ38_9ACTN|nr:hypothetical protein [Actinoplanes bogorensis]MBU2663428.1 hypothetical protein [Actinoplanes bogorensis]
MSRLLLGGIATGVAGIVVVAGTVMVADPFGAHQAADDQAVVFEPDRPTASAPSTPPAATKPPAKPTPPATAEPPAATKPPAKATTPPTRDIDAAGAARIVRAEFTGARVVETERENDSWELKFLLRGVENEIHVDPATGRLFDHEIEDD